jgi:signal transduction histidine kinase
MSARAARAVGRSLLGITIALSLASAYLAATNGPPVVPVSDDLRAGLSSEIVPIALTIFIAYGSVGALILSRRPKNNLGWLFAVGGAVVAFESFCQIYGYRALATDPGSLPAGRVAAWLEDVLIIPGVTMITIFLFLLFPDGRIGGRGERWVAVLALTGAGLCTVGAVVERTIQGYGELAAPLGLTSTAAMSTALLAVGGASTVFALLASVVLMFRRLRRAVGVERDQLRLLAWAAGVGTVLLLPAVLSPTDLLGRFLPVVYVAGGIGLLLIPLSVGLAILRHQLLDIDLVIRRTVVVAVLGAFITVVYVAIVVGVGAVVGSSGNAILSAIAAAVVALAFQPVRRWAQRVANRLVYGERATPYEVLHEFSERVAGSFGSEDVLSRMATILGEGTGADRAQVWLSIAGELRPAAVWPTSARPSRPVAARDGGPPGIPDVSTAVPVLDRGELLGALSVTKPPTDPVTNTEERLVADLALQAGLVLRNARLVEDLRASRGRLVAAQDEERRRIERNIHDGAQQQLVALSVKARLADRSIERDAARAHALLAELQTDAADTLDDLRDLARGIYPPLLVDRGLAAALEAQARKATIPVRVLAEGIARYPREIEATAYFCSLEALQNATKYASAASVRVELADPDGWLRFAVADDGKGFDPVTTPRGSGLQNMSDRLEALGGRLEIRSSAGRGTVVAGRIPIPDRGER